jgi:PEP-CTERM motif
MQLNLNLFGTLAFTAALSAPLASWAALVGPVETDRAAFNARVTVQGTDDFATLPAGDLGLSPATRGAGSFSYTAAAANGLYGLAGQISTVVNTDGLVLSGFTSGVYAIGADFSVDPSASAGQLIFTYNNSVVPTYTLAVPANTTSLFVGFVFNSPIDADQITITSSQLDLNVPVYLAMDNLTLAAAVPEPGTFPMLALGAATLLWAARRRRQGS